MNGPTEIFGLKDRVAVVTGASSGLGAAFAEGLCAAGARVVLAARRQDRLEALEARLTQSGAEVLSVRCDVAVASEVEALARHASERFGRVDVLVNNAGITNVVPALDEPLDQFRRTIDVNLVGAYHCAQLFGRAMIERGSGSIVNIASVLGLVGGGLIPQAAYAASKGGLISLTRELGAQWARRGVRVNALAPGWFPSEMTGEMFADEQGQRFIRSRTPMGRPGELSELIGPLLFLASDASSYMTGQVLVVDGGWTMV
jgi:NAD(P)-dependent dehydrogenase (short-subunit alcohol dehydrogenase family)